MSSRELVIELVNKIPDYQIGYVLAYIQGLNAFEAADDAYCQQMIDRYENDPEKGDLMTFEEVCEQCGVDSNAIRNQV